MSSEEATEEDGGFWPDDLELGDTVEFDGRTYEVVGTGPGEATIESDDEDEITAEVGRWAFTDAVYIEVERSFEQSEFQQMVTAGSNDEQ
jgi:hypothetical protein